MFLFGERTKVGEVFGVGDGTYILYIDDFRRKKYVAYINGYKPLMARLGFSED